MYLELVYTTSISIVMMCGTLYYGVQIVRGKFAPPLGAFIILSVSFGLSWMLYTRTPNWSYTSNIGLATATVSVWSLTITIFLNLICRKGLSIAFNETQKRTLGIAGLIVLFWLITDNPFWSYVLLQTLALVGYWPIVKSLYYGQHNDSLVLWGAIWIANVIAIGPAFQDADLEAYIYIARAMIGTTAVVSLLIRSRMSQKNLLVKTV